LVISVCPRKMVHCEVDKAASPELIV
jgi:hypothetical protein